MSKDFSAKYYQDNKERLGKKAIKRYQTLSKEEKEKNNNMALNSTKIYQKMKNCLKKLSEHRKNYYKTRKSTSL